MRRFDAAELFFYGTIRSLQYLRAEVSFSEYKEQVTDVMADLNHFVGYHKRMVANHPEQRDELRNAIAAAEVLHSFVSGTLYPIRNDLLNKTHIELLNAQLQEFETSLKLDLAALPIYVLEDKRGYSARQFITGDGGRVVFAKRDQAALPRSALEDFDHAGKCLIHEQYTAAGFHTMRALEVVARRYYKTVTGEEPIDDKNRPFPLGVLVNALEGKLKNLSSGRNTERLSQDVLPVLKRIVRKYRNPIMHPEMTLEEDDAIDVFDNAKAAIASILRDVSEDDHGD
jgi:hypothetical protein